MRFNTGEIPASVMGVVAVGNVYPAQGNRPTVAWVVVSVRNGRITLLGIDAEGEVCSGQTYAEHTMQDRPLIGRCAGVETMALDIEWLNDSRGRSFK